VRFVRRFNPPALGSSLPVQATNLVMRLALTSILERVAFVPADAKRY
jgi:hypothetical protein